MGTRFLNKVSAQSTVIASVMIFMVLNAFLPLNLSPLEAEVTQYPFKLVMKLDKTTYSLGETVNITISLTNISDENVTLSLAAGGQPQFDFLIYDWFNNLIYQRSFDRGYAAGGPNVSFIPNQSFTTTHMWDQRMRSDISDGDLVAPGKYYVVGRPFQIFRYYPEYYPENLVLQRLLLETPRLGITIQ